VVDLMKKQQPQTHTGSTHQTVTENIKLQIGKKSIQIGFTGIQLTRCRLPGTARKSSGTMTL
jgi:hypothetical protein